MSRAPALHAEGLGFNSWHFQVGLGKVGLGNPRENVGGMELDGPVL